MILANQSQEPLQQISFFFDNDLRKQHSKNKNKNGSTLITFWTSEGCKRMIRNYFSNA